MSQFTQQVILGLLLGGIYVAVALGFSLVWGILNIVNLAHGALVMVGAYITWTLFARLHVDPFLSLPLDALALFVIGYVLQRGVINRIIRAPLLFTFLLTFGLNLVIVSVLLLIFTADFRSVTPSYSGAGLHLGSVIVPYIRLAGLIVALVLAGLLWLLLNRTRIGAGILAVGADRDAAQLVGIDLRHAYALTFAIGAAFAITETMVRVTGAKRGSTYQMIGMIGVAACVIVCRVVLANRLGIGLNDIVTILTTSRIDSRQTSALLQLMALDLPNIVYIALALAIPYVRFR